MHTLVVSGCTQEQEMVLQSCIMQHTSLAFFSCKQYQWAQLCCGGKGRRAGRGRGRSRLTPQTQPHGEVYIHVASVAQQMGNPN